MATTWWAGFAVEDITPARSLELSGFAARVQPAVGTHDALSARAVALSDGARAAAVAVVDLLGVDATMTERVRERVRDDLGDALEHVSVVATHTHGGPAILRRALLGTVDDAYVEEVVTRTAEAVRWAFAERAPVVIRYGLGHEDSVAKNRRDVDGPIDPDLPVLRFDDPETGRPRGVFCSYACHPVVLGPGNRLYTRDYPGFLVDKLAVACGNAPVAFLTGCCGQINTGHSTLDSVIGRGLEKRTYEEAERIGGVLAGMAAHTAHRIAVPGGIADAQPAAGLWTGSARLRLPLAPVERPDAAEIGALEREAAALAADPQRLGESVVAEAYLRWARTHDPPETHVDTEVAVIALGDVAIVLLPGEVFVEFGLELKRRFPHLHLVIASYANDATGYLPHRSAFAVGGYEVDQAFVHYGFSGPYAVEAGDALIASAAALLHRIGEAR
jgi:neutral ceramidase